MQISVIDTLPTLVAVRVGDVTHDGVGPFVQEALAGIAQALGPAIVGPPLARYDLIEGGFRVEAGFPVSSAPPGLDVITLPGGVAAQGLHSGPYSGLGAAYGQFEEWFGESGHEMTGAPWETYLDEPDVPEPRTLITWPCRPVS